MSENKKTTEQPANADLVLINTVSRLGCTVAEAKKLLAEQAEAAQANLTPAPKPAQPTSKGGTEGGNADEALL